MNDRELTIIIGAPRSGTTWLAKVFDSHTGVFYRHEPDQLAGRDFRPVICPGAPDDALRVRALIFAGRFDGTKCSQSARPFAH